MHQNRLDYTRDTGAFRLGSGGLPIADRVSLSQCQLGVGSGFHPTSQSYAATVQILRIDLPAWGWSRS